MQNVEWENVEFYLPLNFVYEAGDNNPGIHVADILTEREYVQGGGARLIGPLTQIRSDNRKNYPASSSASGSTITFRSSRNSLPCNTSSSISCS